MNQEERKNADSITFSLFAVIYTAIIFLWVALTPSDIIERFFWNYSREKFFLVVFFFFILLVELLSLLLTRKRYLNLFFNWFLNSKVIHLLSIVLCIGSIIFVMASFAGLFKEYTQITQHLFPIVFFIICFTFETFVIQLIHTQEKIGGSLWNKISNVKLSRENKIIFLALLVLIGFLLAIVVNYYRGSYEGRPYPYNTFLFETDDKFSDFFVVVNETNGMDPYGKYLSGQYPFLLLTSSIFSIFNSKISYFIFILCFSIFYYLFSYYFLRIKELSIGVLLTFIITTFTYPLMFSLDRGNFELLVFAFLLVFIYFYQKEKYLPAAIFLGLAAALKIYPAIFLLLFLKDKKFKEGIYSLGTMAILSIVSLLIFKGGLWNNLLYLLNFSNISNNSVFLSFTSIGKGTWVQRGVTIFSLIKIVVQQMNIPLSEFVTQHFSTIYYILVIIVFLPIAYTVLFVEKEFWKNVALLTISMLILPTLSADYKLMHLYLPLFLFINSKQSNRLDLVYLLLFAFLLIPKNYFFLQGVVSDASECHDISLAVTNNIVALLTMTIAIICSGWIGKKKRDKPASL